MRHTQGMTIDAARKAVLATSELLEAILLNLPSTAVFASQRVCRLFRETVKTSKMIKQKLFLETFAVELSWALQVESGQVNGYWNEVASVKFVRATEPGADAKLVMPARLNPLLDVDSLYDRNVQYTAHNLWVRQSTEVWWRPRKAPYLARPASYHQTYLTNPPCKSASIRFSWMLKTKPAARGHVYKEVHDPNGLTLGSLLDAVLDTEGGFGYAQARKWIYEDARSLRDVLVQLEQDFGGRTTIDKTTISITLKGVALPTEEEWEAMK